MSIYILSITAILTLMLNTLLTWYLLKDKHTETSYSPDTKEIINFILTPGSQSDIAETEALVGELSFKDDLRNEHN